MTDPKQQDPSAAIAASPESYEPPQLVLLGNLRDLVGKSGGEEDAMDPAGKA